MDGRFRTLLLPVLGVIMVIVPPYAYEKLAQYLFLTHSPLFFVLSGTRYYFDVGYLPLAAGILGYKFGNPVRAWSTYLVSVFLLVSLLFALCEPRLCYSGGPDGFEPVRMGSFFAAEGVAAAYVGTGGARNVSNGSWQRAFVVACGFYAVAYNPVIFTLAGARVLSPLDPFVTLFFLGILSLMMTVRFGRESKAASVVAPFFAQVSLLLIGGGIAWRYFPEILPFVVWSLVAVAAGSIVGLAFAGGDSPGHRWLRKSRYPFVFIVLFVLLSTLVVWPDAVAGQVTAFSNPGEPTSYSYAIPLYVGGFLSSPMVRPTAVALNVSSIDFPSSTPSRENFIAAGIGVHSADCCTDGIDYGFRFDLLRWENGSESLSASAWLICDANGACGGHSWKVLMYHVLVRYEEIGQPLRLELRWENRTVVWHYETGPESHVLGSLEALPHMNAAFNAGWLGPPAEPSPGGALFFQFGISGLTPLSGSWAVTFTCPAVFLNGAWECVDHAQSVQGDQSYWKILWRWGETFPNVDATVDVADRSVTFHASGTTISGFVVFW